MAVDTGWDFAEVDVLVLLAELLLDLLCVSRLMELSLLGSGLFRSGTWSLLSEVLSFLSFNGCLLLEDLVQSCVRGYRMCSVAIECVLRL